jgi:hypothetical protein
MNEYYKNIKNFIENNYYTYTVDRVIEEYQNKYLKGYYVSHTMKNCIENLKNDINEALKVKSEIITQEIQDKWIIEAEFHGKWTGLKKKKYIYNYEEKLFYYYNNLKYNFCGKVATIEGLKDKVYKSKTVTTCILYDEDKNILFRFNKGDE